MGGSTAIAVAVATTLLASSGFWTWLTTRRERKSASTRLLMGLAYDKLTYLGLKHIERGYIPGDEYEDFMKYLYEPYIELGGNGMASRVMDEVAKLPLRKGPPIQTPPTVTEKQIADGDEYNGESSW